ncbi:hypothetical protein ACELLULO517_05230 [Acidisoma cellulosilytica]|uniref:Hemolysin XhlA n=1 Tax=Acidisoma cellulosilyticum TaxID=2802395 RepID=A0A963YYJ6_9PROT|nr:hypothetical protein [Acidisoma cellulosilyticum]MCB8879628.1 hypothetical protein [Acidisoma cellulosilyticum]
MTGKLIPYPVPMAASDNSLVNDAGGGDSGGMESRLTKLETHFEYVQRDLAEIKADQKTISHQLIGIDKKLDRLPTNDDLWSWKIQWIAIGIGAVALIVGGIIGGLSWLK